MPDAAALRLFSGPRLSWPLTPGQLRTMERIEGLSAWAVTERGELVGHFDLTVDGRAARIGRVIVDPDLRGRGLASGVIELALSKARDLGTERVELNVISGNEPAFRTYLRAGFAPIDGDPARPDVVRMMRRL